MANSSFYSSNETPAELALSQDILETVRTLSLNVADNKNAVEIARITVENDLIASESARTLTLQYKGEIETLKLQIEASAADAANTATFASTVAANAATTLSTVTAASNAAQTARDQAEAFRDQTSANAVATAGHAANVANAVTLVFDARDVALDAGTTAVAARDAAEGHAANASTARADIFTVRDEAGAHAANAAASAGTATSNAGASAISLTNTIAARDAAIVVRDESVSARSDAVAARDATIGYRDQAGSHASNAAAAIATVNGARDATLLARTETQGFAANASAALADAVTAKDLTLGFATTATNASSNAAADAATAVVARDETLTAKNQAETALSGTVGYRDQTAQFALDAANSAADAALFDPSNYVPKSIGGTFNAAIFAPTATVGTDSTEIATTAFVKAAIDASPASGDMAKAVYDTNNNGIVDRAALADAVAWADVSGKPSLALLASPAFTGTPTSTTAAAGTNTLQIATTAFVTDGLNLKANLASPTFTGIPAAPTAAAGTNTTQLASTAFVTAGLNLKANLASPALTGTPTAPTAAGGTSSTQLATTAFVTTAVASKGDMLKSVYDTNNDGIVDRAALADAVAWTDVSGKPDVWHSGNFDPNLKANLASPALTGTPTAPTASAGTSSTQVATTAFVTTGLNLKANLASPTFTGTVAGVTKAHVGLGNVDDTSDTNKPISTTQAAGLEPLGKLAGINTQTSSYTAVLADAGRVVELNNASANNFTVPPNSAVAFPTNARIDLVQYGAGQTTIVAGAGVTIRSAGGKLKLTGQYSGASLYQRATNEWVLIGDLAS